MDDLSALPPENWNTSPRRRRQDSPSTVRTDRSSWRASNNHQRPLSINTAVAPQSEMPLIFAPTPRRHLIENPASQHWLHNTSNSPPSSRSPSPFWQTSGQPHPSCSDSRASPHLPGSTLFQTRHTGPVLPHSPTSSVSLHRTSPSNVVRRRRLSGSISKPNRLTELLPGLEPPKYLASPNLRGDREYGSPRVPAGGLKQYAAEPDEPAMGRRWIRWMHRRGLKQCVIPGILGVSTIFKLMIGLGSYSGYATPPMYGDYEAQRHWMEITKHLPLKQWYTYDLQYWGLDYPPLTAYLSWLCGVLAHWINPSWVALDASRGVETPEGKVFMRLSVVLSDWLVYVPSLLLFIWTWQPHRSKRTQHHSLLTLIFQPSLLLIDFGHFQYNSVMLGLTLLAMDFFAVGEDALGAFCFVLSLGFKQMALYYAPAIGSYLLAKCLYLGTVKGGRLFLQLAIVTLSTFILLFLPWLPPFASFSAILQPIIRIFPFSRGLFEDKVANFWCASNVIVKWKTRASTGTLVKLSTLLTVLGFLPSVVGLLRAGVTIVPSPTVIKGVSPEAPLQKPGASREIPTFLQLLPYGLLTSSMSFFLFSFQVHEKTILLPLMPMTLLLTNANFDSTEYHWGLLFNNVSVFSMWPLLKRDGLGVQYIATLLLWNRLLGFNPFRLNHKTFIQIISMGVYAAVATLHILELLLKPPSRYPDLYQVLNVLVSTPVFVLVWLWSIKSGIEKQWALGGLRITTSSVSAVTTPRENSEEAASISGDASPRVLSRSRQPESQR